jgi:hypothetical protein
MDALNKFAGSVYLGFLIADNYPDQEPAHVAAKWYDLFWFAIPILGFLFFVLTIELRYERKLTMTVPIKIKICLDCCFVCEDYNETCPYCGGDSFTDSDDGEGEDFLYDNN